MDTESIIFSIGPLAITRPVVTTWAVMLGLTCCVRSPRAGSRLGPGRLQTMLEGVVSTIHAAIEDALPGYGERLLPFIGSLWIFIAIANLVGVLPGAASPTGDLSTTARWRSWCSSRCTGSASAAKGWASTCATTCSPA